MSLTCVVLTIEVCARSSPAGSSDVGLQLILGRLGIRQLR
jgi:hypothetical protein